MQQRAAGWIQTWIAAKDSAYPQSYKLYIVFISMILFFIHARWPTSAIKLQETLQPSVEVKTTKLLPKETIVVIFFFHTALVTCRFIIQTRPQ